MLVKGLKALDELHFTLTHYTIADKDSKTSGGNDVYTPELYSIRVFIWKCLWSRFYSGSSRAAPRVAWVLRSAQECSGAAAVLLREYKFNLIVKTLEGAWDN